MPVSGAKTKNWQDFHSHFCFAYTLIYVKEINVNCLFDISKVFTVFIFMLQLAHPATTNGINVDRKEEDNDIFRTILG